MKRLYAVLCAAALLAPAGYAQVGIFDGMTDIGEVPVPAESSESDGTYTVETVGTNVGRSNFMDSFHFIHTQVSGSFAIIGTPFPIEPVGEAGLMVRQDLDPDSAHISLLQQGPAGDQGGNTGSDTGSVFPHFRSLKGGGTIVDGDPSENAADPGGFTLRNTGPLRLERLGNSVHIYTFGIDVNDPESGPDDEWVLLQSEAAILQDTVYAGLAGVARSAEAIGVFEFTDVEIVEYPLNVMRGVPVDDVTPNETVEGITVTASVREGQTVDAVVTEIVPTDAVWSNVQVSAGELTVTPGVSIQWVLSGFSGEATLTYDLTLGPRDAAVWRGTFNDGERPESFIGGDQLLPKVPAIEPLTEPVELDPENPVVIQAENGNIPSGSTDTWGLFFDPDAESGVTLVQVNTGIANYLEFPIIIPEGYGDIYMFGNVRGEDGNSDSFFVDIEFEPVSDNLTIWDSGGGKSLHRDWVRNRNGEDPRPFFGLTTGENWIYVSGRENSTSFDWIAVTNDPSIDIDAFVEVEPAPVTNVAEFMLF